VGIELNDQRIAAEFLVDWQDAEVVARQPQDRVARLASGSNGLAGRLPPVHAIVESFEQVLLAGDRFAKSVRPSRLRLPFRVGKHFLECVAE
jgi:hypothetical protein